MMIDSGLVVELAFVTASGEVSRGEKMLYSGTDPETYITEYTLVYEDKNDVTLRAGGRQTLVVMGDASDGSWSARATVALQGYLAHKKHPWWAADLWSARATLALASHTTGVPRS